jgi:hypothetical protein
LRGITAARAAEELHVSPARISRALPLLALPDEFQAAVRTGRLRQETAYYISRVEGEDRAHLFARALAGTLSRDEAARAAKATRPQTAEAPVGRVTCKLPGGRSLTVSGAAIKLDGFIQTLELVLQEARKARQQNWDLTTLAKVFRDRSAGGAQ